jgi:hypothetical protein
MRKQSREDFQLFVTLRKEDAFVERVSCKVFLPQKHTDKLFFEFRPNEDQAKKINDVILPEYSLYGEVKDQSGQVIKTVEADKVWTTKHLRETNAVF